MPVCTNFVCRLSFVSAFLFLICLSAGNSLAQPVQVEVNQKFTAAELKEDVDFYLKALDESHVNPYANVSKKELQAKADWIKVQIDKKGAMTQKEFWLLFTPLVGALQDSHTNVIDPRFFIKGEDPTKYFPVRTINIDGKIVVKESFADEKVEKGAVIASINGINSREIIRKLSDYRFGVEREKADGAVSWLWVGMAEVFGHPEEFEIAFADGKKTRVKGLNLPEFIRREKASREAAAAANAPAKTDSPLTLKFLDGNIAYLESTTFAYDFDKYRELLKEIFTQIKTAGAKSLIIDVRRNGGGNSQLGDALIDMFNSKSYRHYSMKWKKSAQYADFMKQRKAFVPDVYEKLQPGEFYSSESETVKASAENPLRFSGQVLVLSSKETFSSAQMFVAVVKDNKLAQLVGEETNEPACSFGEIYFFNLPNSKLRNTMSVKYWIPPAGCRGTRGITPDVTVERHVADYVASRDAILETALNLIKQKR